LISNGQANVEGIAECLGVSSRTLQRRLIAEGQSFGKLLNETRREVAARYLMNSNLSITAVAQLTGYSALSSFTRWFIAEFGMSPRKWRSRMLTGEEIQARPSRPTAFRPEPLEASLAI
jgi:AraC-like DNA-binding protein